MKKFLSALFVSLIILSCQETTSHSEPTPEKIQVEDPNTFETALYDCVVKKYADQGIDLPGIHLELENLAIKTGNLADASAKSYFNMFKLAASAKHFPLNQEDLFFEKLALIPNFPVNLNCNSDLGLPETVGKSSKLSKYNRLLSVEISKTRNKGIQPNTALPIIKAYTEADFDNDFIKLSMLAFISYRTSIENKIYENK